MQIQYKSNSTVLTQFTIIIIHIYDITINGIYNFFAIHMLVCSGYSKPETENDIHLDQYIIINTNKFNIQTLQIIQTND